VSLLSGCEYISEVNSKLKPEQQLAQVWKFSRFADQSQLSIYLDRLTQTNLSQLSVAVGQIGHQLSYLRHHDWRGFLTVDLDLSGLPCSKQSEGAQKGYMSGKKISSDDN